MTECDKLIKFIHAYMLCANTSCEDCVKIHKTHACPTTENKWVNKQKAIELLEYLTTEIEKVERCKSDIPYFYGTLPFDVTWTEEDILRLIVPAEE